MRKIIIAILVFTLCQPLIFVNGSNVTAEVKQVQLQTQEKYYLSATIATKKGENVAQFIIDKGNKGADYVAVGTKIDENEKTIFATYTYTGEPCKAKIYLRVGNGDVKFEYTVKDFVVGTGESFKTDNGTKFYVDSIKGKDSNNGSIDAPFKSIEQAKFTVSQINKDMTKDIIIYLNGGTYFLDKQLNFSSKDSGYNGFNVVYKAVDGENVIVSGGEKIQNWTLHDKEKNIYKASAHGIDTRQLYVNGKRAIRAKSKAGLTNPKSDDGQVGIVTDDLAAVNWQNQSELEMVFKTKWSLPRIGVKSVTQKDGKALFTMNQPTWKVGVNRAPSSIRLNTPWYVENAYELLDEEGEFYLDKKADIFYYKPRANEDIASINAIAPKLETLVSMEGSGLSQPVRNISFEGIKFQNTTWLEPNNSDHLDNQNNFRMDGIMCPAAVYGKRVENINFTKCEFSNLGGDGIQMEKGVQNCNIIGNNFYDISAKSMNIGEYNANPNNKKLYNDNIQIKNNYIHNVAVEYMGSAALSVGFLSNSSISNNEIYNTPYTAIHVGWGWGTVVTSNIKNFKIEHNYIHEVMTELADGGAIYLLGGSGATAENKNPIYQNYIKNQYNATSVLYTDEGSSYYKLSENVIDMVESAEIWPPIYGSAWMYQVNNNDYVRNFVTKNDYINDGTNCTFTDTQVYLDANWPAEAISIINKSGLEDEYKYLKGN